MTTRKSKKPTRADRVASIASDLRDVISDLTELKEEVEEHRDNMAGTPLENTEKYQTLDTATEALGDIADELDTQAALPRGQKRTRKVICEQTGFMPGHMKTCPNDEKYQTKDWIVTRRCPF